MTLHEYAPTIARPVRMSNRAQTQNETRITAFCAAWVINLDPASRGLIASGFSRQGLACAIFGTFRPIQVGRKKHKERKKEPSGIFFVFLVFFVANALRSGF